MENTHCMRIINVQCENQHNELTRAGIYLFINIWFVATTLPYLEWPNQFFSLHGNLTRVDLTVVVFFLVICSMDLDDEDERSVLLLLKICR